MWVALAEGRRYREVASAAVAAEDREPAVGDAVRMPAGLSTDPAKVAWRVVRDRRFAAAFAPLVDECWKPLAEPAKDLLGQLIEEATPSEASDDAKRRGLEAAKEILRRSDPVVSGGGGGGRAEVHVHGDATLSLGLEELLAGREPARRRALSAGRRALAEDVEAPTVDSTMDRRARTSSTAGAAARARTRESREG